VRLSCTGEVSAIFSFVSLRAVKNLRLIWRLLYFAVFTTRIVGEIWLRDQLQGRDLQRAMRIRRKWARKVLYKVGVRVEEEGEIPQGKGLLVGNHRSYLDPIILLRNIDAWPVAKAEIATWPMIGKGAAMAGILYLRREDAAHRARVLILIKETIEAGFPVILFPEGNTCDDPEKTLPFLTGGFRLAAKHGYGVTPIAFHFHDPRDFWVGEVTFLGHAWQSFSRDTVHVTVCYGPTLYHSDPEILLNEAHQWIENKLKEKVKLNLVYV